MNIALVPVYDDPIYFQWLGSRRVVEHLFEKLRQIRELTAIRVVTTCPEKLQELPSWHDGEFQVHTIVRPITPLISLCRDVQSGNTATTYVAVDPLFPFLHRGKIEKALYSVINDEDCVPAITVHGRWSLHRQINRVDVTAHSPMVDACVAVRAAPHVQPGDMNSLGTSYTEVSINAIEAIDMRTAEGRRIAETLADSGIL